MVISAINLPDYLYINLHAEEVITSNYIAGDNSGIFGSRLQIITFERIVDYIVAINPKHGNIVLDFDRISKCQPNLNQKLIDLKNIGYTIVLLNCKKIIIEELMLTSIKNSKNILVGELYQKFNFFESDSAPISDTLINSNELFRDKFKETIKNYIDKHPKPHTSSYVYLTSYVDLKKFASIEKELMAFSIYKLALKIDKEWNLSEHKDCILVCQSLNSAYIVSFLSILLKLDLLILDKVGPVNKIYNKLDKTISSKHKYIVVSDLVCLGTEIKIVKSLIQFMGGKYLGNVSIIKTETLSKKDILRKDATIAVFSINKTNNKELGYSITTDLEPIP